MVQRTIATLLGKSRQTFTEKKTHFHFNENDGYFNAVAMDLTLISMRPFAARLQFLPTSKN